MEIARNTRFASYILFQALAVFVLWLLLALYVYFFFRPANLGEQISLVTLFIGVPAAVIGVTQLWISAHIQRAAYIKDYALRYRTDKELSESFHYLVYLFGNNLYEAYIKSPETRTHDEKIALKSAQEGISEDLRFFNPKSAIGGEQERRLDNLLGFFDTVGYDYRRDLLQMRDIAGVFGFQLDHLIQRKVIQEYLDFVNYQWPTKKSFHENYDAPVPFRYLRFLLHSYIDFRRNENKRVANIEDI